MINAWSQYEIVCDYQEQDESAHQVPTCKESVLEVSPVYEWSMEELWNHALEEAREHGWWYDPDSDTIYCPSHSESV